jgi:hypothetical protein
MQHAGREGWGMSRTLPSELCNRLLGLWAAAAAGAHADALGGGKSLATLSCRFLGKFTSNFLRSSFVRGQLARVLGSMRRQLQTGEGDVLVGSSAA